jgi:TonB family protein
MVMMTSTTRRFISALIVGSLHVLAAWTISRGVIPPAAPPVMETLVTTYIEPRVVKRGATVSGQNLSKISTLRTNSWPALHVDIPLIDYEVSRNAAAMLAAPTLDPEPAVDIYPYIIEAALLPGEGATVVLRIEMLADGSAGRIAIDVSSGSEHVDQAASDYARAHRWAPATVAGAAHSMWIRWGVRLQA